MSPLHCYIWWACCYIVTSDESGLGLADLGLAVIPLWLSWWDFGGDLFGVASARMPEHMHISTSFVQARSQGARARAPKIYHF